MQVEKDNEFLDEDVKEALSRVIKSHKFKKAYRLRQLLEHLVSKHLEGKKEDLKGYSIGVDVFDKGTDFDPDSDTIVRVQMVRLRGMLEHYYLTEGKDDPLIIDVPKGRYIPSYSMQAVLEDDESGDEELGDIISKKSKKTRRRFKEFFKDDPIILALVVSTVFLMSYLLFSPDRQVVTNQLPKRIVAMPSGPSIAVFPFDNATGKNSSIC